MELHSREALAPVFADLNRYDATSHFVGQSTILSLSGNRATGEAYCLAHHVTVDGSSKRRLMVASLRYLDTFVKNDGAWLFSERRLCVDWVNERGVGMTVPQRRLVTLRRSGQSWRIVAAAIHAPDGGPGR